MLVKFKSTYNKELDKVNCALLIAPTFFLALFVHPSVNSSYTSDVKRKMLLVDNELYRLLGHFLSIWNRSLCSLRFICSQRKYAVFFYLN